MTDNSTPIEPTQEPDLNAEQLAQLLNNAKKTVETTNRYPLEFKLLALKLRSLGRSYQNIADTLNVKSDSTIYQWCNDSTILDNVHAMDLVNDISDSMSSGLKLKASTLFSKAMDDDKLAKASTLQLVTAGGIMIDKSQVLSSKPTSIIQIEGQVETLAEQTVTIDAEIVEAEAELKRLSDS